MVLKGVERWSELSTFRVGLQRTTSRVADLGSCPNRQPSACECPRDATISARHAPKVIYAAIMCRHIAHPISGEPASACEKEARDISRAGQAGALETRRR